VAAVVAFASLGLALIISARACRDMENKPGFPGLYADRDEQYLAQLSVTTSDSTLLAD
jgi:hypothetical protein